MGFDDSLSASARADGVQQALCSGHHDQARQLLLDWLRHWALSLPAQPDRDSLRQPELWSALAAYAERSGELDLIERLYQVLDRLPAWAPPQGELESLPLLGIPILNRVDLLLRLLDSLDCPVETLAVVDNSMGWQPGGDAAVHSVQAALQLLEQGGHPLIQHIRIARPFTNLGVAASWNLILSSFPQAACALLANNDICFSPGVLNQALRRLDARRAQILPLLPPPQAFSCFLITARCWDQLGLFDPNFHPAYCEDLDYRDRLQRATQVDQLDGSFAHAAMASLNTSHSATINSDPLLAHYNRTSYPLNQLWYLSDRRRRHDPRGCWRRLWLAQWSP